MRYRAEEVYDHRGRGIGTVRLVFLGRKHTHVWHATDLDGGHLGAFVRRVDAETAVWESWVDSRDSVAIGER